MKQILIKKILTGLALVSTVCATLVQAQDSYVVIGKDDWLFTKYEFATPTDASDTNATIGLLEKANQLFARNDIALALVIVPSKIRIYSDQLPTDKPLDSYTNGKYENIYQLLREKGVHVVNLNQAFLNSPKRSGNETLFLHQDTHWSPTGALLAAETIRTEIDQNPALNKAWSSIPEEKFSLTWATKAKLSRARDLVKYLPASSPSYAPEKTTFFKVAKESKAQAGLLTDGDKVGITVIGSSYTNKNTGYPDGLRFTLQRNLLDISIPVDQGPWVGMEAYLKDDAFKTNKPKMIIWEIPEREFRSPPNNKFRDPRYIIDNAEWLARITKLLG